MRKVKVIIIFSVLMLMSSALFSLGAFNLFNGRNRPDLSWHEVNTDNVKIVYSDNLYQMALESAAIADSTYATLVKSFNIHPDKQVVIYISDQDAISNGAALLDHYIFIWVSTNDFVKFFTGNHKWLRKVIAHEMVHWFVFYSLQDWLSPFLPVGQMSFPMNMHEGYAQFFSGEPWGLNRGDKYLRTYALADLEQGISSRWYGGFMYANGFAFVKYLAEFYGEDKLTELLQYRGDLKLYDFEKGFKKVYNKSYKELFAEWSKYIKTWYFGEAYLQKLNFTDSYSRELTVNSVVPFETNMQINDIVIKVDQVIASVKLSKNQGFQSLVQGVYDIDSLKVNKFYIKDYKVISNGSAFTDIDISSNGEFVVFSEYTRHKYGRIASSVRLKDSKGVRDLGAGALPVVSNTGTVYYQKLSLSDNTVYRVRDMVSEEFLSLQPENQIGELRLNPAGNYLAMSIFDQDREFLTAIFDTQTKEAVEVLKFNNMPQSLLWQDDNKLAVMVENEHDFKIEVYVFNMQDRSFKRYHTPPFNIYPRLLVEYDEGLRCISLSEINRSRKVISKVNLPENLTPENESFAKPVNYYSRWISREARYQIPENIVAYENLSPVKYRPYRNIKYRQGLVLPFGNGIFSTLVLSEALGKHVITGTAYLPLEKSKEPFGAFNYINTSFKPTLSVNAVHTKWVAGMQNDKMIANKLSFLNVSASFPADFYKGRFSGLNYAAGLSYYKFSLAKESAAYAYMFDEDDLLIANASLDYWYNLPWRHDIYHSVRSFKVGLSFDYSDDKLGMQRDYQQLSVYTDYSYAPFLSVFKSELLKTVSLQNRSSYRVVHKNPLQQFLPGVDDAENIVFTGQPAFSRFYLRGFEEKLWGKEILSTQTDLKIKLFDDVKVAFVWGSPLISSDYLGLSVWYDYTKLSRIQFMNENESADYQEFKALGLEFRSAWNLFGINTLHRFGQAWDTNKTKLGYYYLLEIPFNKF